jgi:general secretion pathway protein G
MTEEKREFHTEPQSHRGESVPRRSPRAANFLARFARRPTPLRTHARPVTGKSLRGSVALCESSSSHNEAGYTLMELLVVLAILGLLAAIATPMVLKYLDSAKVGTAKTEVANISAGLDLFKYDVGRYPTTQEGLDALVKAPPTADNWNGPYVKTTTNLKDPWGHPFGYRAPGEHGDFDLYSDGPTGKEDTGGKPAIANW